MNQAPMKITLYGPDDEVMGEFTRMFVPWKLLKVAIRVAKKLKNVNPDAMTEEDVDELAGLVVEVFGNKFSIKDLDEGASLDEMMAVLNAIIARAGGSNGNPTPPPG